MDMLGNLTKWKSKTITEYELAEWRRVVLKPLFGIFKWLVVAEPVIFLLCPPAGGMTRLEYFLEYRILPLAAALVVILCMKLFLKKIAQHLDVTAVAIVTMTFLNVYMGIFQYLYRNQPFMIVIVLFPIVIAPIYKKKELIYLQAAISLLMLIWAEFICQPIGQQRQSGIAVEKLISIALIFYTMIRFEKEIMITTNMLGEQSSIDSLTRLLNHEAFYAELDERMKEFAQEKEPFSLIIIDIDNFKKVNDTYGHAFGDEVLRRIAEIIKYNKGSRSVCARYGGEEFAIILPNKELNDAILQAERIRREFEKEEFQTKEGAKHHFSVSLGVAEYNREYPTASAFFEMADKALYEAKGTGKNRVCCSR